MRGPRGGYVAIQTSFRDKEAKRSLGYILDPASLVACELDAGNEYDGLLSVLDERYTVSMEPLLDDSGKPIGALTVGQLLAAAEALLSESVSSALSRILAGTAMIVVMVVFFSFFNLRSSIAPPLRHTVEVLGSIAAEGGDLTRRIESKRSDETGRLAFQFNTFIGRLRGEFAAVKEKASRLKTTAMEVEREAAETTAAVARIGDGIEAARESASETASKTGAVLELNDLIGNVADRTRILAMDAAIEAAHAGDHGKGFAVVPDEIRNLAEEASTRAAETATGLRGIQEATLRLTEASDPVGLAFSGIDESVEHTDSALQSIAGRMSAQRSGAEEAAGIEAGARRAEESARRNTMGASALEAGLAHYVTELPQETGSIAQEA
jgi:methyl-accepting chemotaxis protein